MKGNTPFTKHRDRQQRDRAWRRREREPVFFRTDSNRLCMGAAAKMRAQEECLRVDSEKMHACTHTPTHTQNHVQSCVINKAQMATVKTRNMSFLDSGTKKQANCIHVVVAT